VRWRTTLPALALLGSAVAPSPARAVEYEVQQWQLEPGTEVLLVEDHRAPLVTVTIEFPVGHWSAWARDHHAEEACDIQMHDPAGSLRARADRLSVDLSVGMGSHHAAVTASCLREDVAAVLDLVRDVLGNRDFDAAELKRWNKNDRLEWDASRKEPWFRLTQAGARLLYDADDPRRRDSEKPRPRITNSARLAEARDVVVRLPGRVIAFSGDLTRADAERMAAGLLPPVTDSPPDGLSPVLAPMTPMDELPAEHVETMPKIQQTFFAYGRHSLAYDSPQYPAFLVADHVLGGHFFSRMYQALRHEGGETYGTGTTGHGGTHREGYALVTFTRGDNAEVTEQKLRDVLLRLHDGGITEEERQAAVGYLVGSRAFSRQAPSQILERRLWERRHGLPAGFYDALVDRAAQVGLDEINAFTREFYDPSLFKMIEISPQ
jgi:predicted Zn-dependent peptidase